MDEASAKAVASGRWRKRRWIAVGLVLWLAGYVVSLLPAAYVAGRFPATEDALTVLYAPVLFFAWRSPRPSPYSCPYFDEVFRLGRLGRQHRAAVSTQDAPALGRQPTPEELEAAGRKINRTHWTPPAEPAP